MKIFTIEEITHVVNGLLNKVEDTKISKIAPPLLADENTLALALSEAEIENLEKTKAKAALVPLGVGLENITTIEVERPRLAMMKLLNMFYTEPETEAGIHPQAVVHESAKLGKNVSIGPNVVISKNVEIGDNTKIMANSYIGGGSKIGSDCFFHASVNIGDRIIIGNKVILHHGVSLGADGFSFVTENPDNIEQARKEGAILEENITQKIFKIPSIGSVRISDNVEIGANTTIDRGTIEDTIIGEDTKIDNQVMIGHNCRVGKGCMIISQVGIAGSCVIGDRVVIAGQAGLADHIIIGNDSIIGAAAGVTKSFPEKSIIIGGPAVPRKEFIRQLKTMKDADELIKKFKKYEPILKSFEESGKLEEE
jgi:UDP-3-O-[3-hydroxymyristoyl] glucosamine N-acyltransferase